MINLGPQGSDGVNQIVIVVAERCVISAECTHILGLEMNITDSLDKIIDRLGNYRHLCIEFKGITKAAGVMCMGIDILLLDEVVCLVNYALKSQEVFGRCVYVFFCFSEKLQIEFPDSAVVMNCNSGSSTKLQNFRCRSISMEMFSILSSRFKVE